MAKEKYELAEEDYIKGMKYKDIADKYEVSLNTVKSWKTRYKWSKEGAPKTNKSVHTKKEKVRTQKKSSATKNKVKKEAIAEEIEEVLANTELNNRQRLFCVIYSRCLNATKAYQEAYKCAYESAMMNGSRLLRNDKVKEQVESLNAVQFNAEFIKKSLIQKYLDIAFSDITKFMKFGKKDKIQYGSNGKPILNEYGEIQTYEESYVELRESDQIDGTLISEISEGNAGIKVKLTDKMKAMDFLTKHYNLLNDEEKTQLDIEYKKLQNRKIGAEITKINGESDDDVKEDDGFIDALNGTAKEDWADEEV